MRDTSSRREKIASMLRSAGSVQVPVLAERFGVSEVTIRNDLKFLDDLGVSIRTYGGAILNEGNNRIVERAIEHKEQLHAREKSAIGKVAAGYVEAGDAIILDSGSTTYQIATRLADKDGVTVITNGLNVMNKLARFEHLELIMLGGTLRRKNMSFFGTHAERSLRDLHVDKLFLGVDGFHMEKGITTHFEAEAQLNRLMRHAASTTIVVTDSSKFGRICLHQIMEVEHISTVITDKGIGDEYRTRLEKSGIRVVVAEDE
jgi:DeoR family transcriptional regulator, aga operon transcriptional repressor